MQCRSEENNFSTEQLFHRELVNYKIEEKRISLLYFLLSFFRPHYRPTVSRSTTFSEGIVVQCRVHARNSRVMELNANTFCDFINDGDAVCHVGPLHREHTTLLYVYTLLKLSKLYRCVKSFEVGCVSIH